MNVPKIRFPEYCDEWKSKQLSELAEIIDGDRGKNYPKESEFYDEEYCLFLNAGNVTKSGFDFSNTMFITKEKDMLLRKGKLSRNDIVLTTRGTVGNVAYYNQTIPYNDIRINSGMVIVRSNNYIEHKYLYSFMKSPKFDLQVKRTNFGSAQPQLTIKGLSKFLVSYSSNDEQIKVSNFLSLLDKKIELQSKKIEDLKLFKLCIRKTIFSLNADTNIKLKDIVNCESSNITLSDIENDNGMYPVYGATGFIKNIKNHKFDSEYIAIVKDGAGVGRTMMCPKNSSILATMNALIVKNNYPLNYICEMINTISFDKYIVGSGIPHIYFKDYGNEEFMMHNINDAIKFNNFFKCIDKKIELLNIKLDKLNTLKKGLMQNMFV